MERYGNRSGASGVLAFEIRDASIVVLFGDRWAYEYGARRPGPDAVETMKSLARAGRGLSTFISQHVRQNFERKFRVRESSLRR
jgi:hypothetical protein